MAKEPKIGAYLDEEERQIIQAAEADDFVFVSLLTPELEKEVEAMARAKLSAIREKSLTVSLDES